MGALRIMVYGFFILCVNFASDSVDLGCDFPAVYNFGDSNSDTGAVSAAFWPIPAPNGLNFFKKPAGRDSDGRLVIDFIGKLTHEYCLVSV